VEKFDHILEFGRALPRIRRRVARDLRKSGLPRDRVLATIVRLLDKTLVRVGNEEYARANHSFGLTTLRNRHVSVTGNTLHLEFRGKSGILHSISVNDPALARLVRRCADIPGQELFQWIDVEGRRHRIDPEVLLGYSQGRLAALPRISITNALKSLLGKRKRNPSR
jgi:DNA topoisomerase-1